LELYKRFFSDDEIEYGNYDTNYQRIIDADAGGYYTSLIRCKESAIRTERYAKILKDEFIKCIDRLKNKQYYVTSDLTKDLSDHFNKFIIRFIFTGGDTPKLEDEEERKSVEDGISEMRTLAVSKEIQVLVNKNFMSKFKSGDKELINTFYLLMCHELVHRGQCIFRRYFSLSSEAEFIKRDQKKLENPNLSPAKAKVLRDKLYRRRKAEIMSYANQALEELRFKGYSDKVILDKFRTGDVDEIESPTFLKYITTFKTDSEDKEHDKIILNKFYKYLYDYVTGEENHNFII